MPSTIDKYLVQMQEAEAPLGIYAYRGQAKAEWKLYSAATRLMVREYGDSITAEAEFRKLYVDYHRDTLIGSARTRGFGVELGRRLNDWELLAKLQHFGAPTGLLSALCASRTTRYTCGLLTRGIFFPPSLLQAQQEDQGFGVELGRRLNDSAPRSARVRRCPLRSLGLRGRPNPWYAGLVHSGSTGQKVKFPGMSRT